MSLKYSIVIPTRNRVEYLQYAVRSVLDSDRNDIELIVSNNHSSDGTDKFLSELKDSRLRIIHPSVVLPMAGHFEFAINEAKGDWITILGDDDAVMPYIFERLDIYIDKYPEAEILSSVRAYYFWEGCEDLYGPVTVGYQSKQIAALRSTKRDLKSVLKGVRSCFDMPQIYTTGIIKRVLYEEIKSKSKGCFYHSIIPDMYSVIALCLSRDQYLRVEEPLFWVGTSNKTMSRSDRIYRDAEQFNENHKTDYPCVPRKISNQISYTIHSFSFSAMYIYECLLSSPLKVKKYQENSVRKDVLSAVLRDIKRRKKNESDHNQIIDLIKKECRIYKISFLSVLFLSKFYILQLKIIWVLQLTKNVLRRLGLSNGMISLHSTRRDMFSNISQASDAVNDLRRLKMGVGNK